MEGKIHGNRKWIYEACREVAMKYRNKRDFKSANSGAYYASKKYGWMKDFTWLADGRITGISKNTKWDYDRCYQVALKVSTRADFQRLNDSAYRKSVKNGWIEDYDWFVDGIKRMAMNNTIWTFESCYQLASRCNSISEFEKESRSACNVARRNGWIRDYIWFQKKYRKITYEICKEIALKCKTRSEFYYKDSSAYGKSSREGWLDSFDWLDRPFNVFSANCDTVYAYFFEKYRMVYVGRTIAPEERDADHRIDSKSAVFRFAQKTKVEIPDMTILESGLTIKEGLIQEHENIVKFASEGWGILNKAKTGEKSGSLGGLSNRKWRKATCEKEAKKYKTLRDFIVHSGSAYSVARKNGWLNSYDWLHTPRKRNGYWTYEACKKEAKKNKTRNEFAKGCSTAYRISREKGWINEYSWFVPRKRWDYESCRQEALKYKRAVDFNRASGNAYRLSVKNGWLNKFPWLSRRSRPIMQLTKTGSFIASYKNASEINKIRGFNTSAILRCCKGKLKSAYGFIWRFADGSGANNNLSDTECLSNILS